jgi:capsular polysaccharide biosynthesis protein
MTLISFEAKNNLYLLTHKTNLINRQNKHTNIILTLEFDCLFSTFGSLKKYPKISGYLDRISKIWIMKKCDIQSIQVSMYPKKTDIHVSKYPVSTISKYPLIQVPI